MVFVFLGDEFGDEAADLSDTAFRTHIEALCWTMKPRPNQASGRITRRDLRRFAETADAEAAVKELASIDWWEEIADGEWQILHDLDKQLTKDQIEARRAANAERQRRWRDRRSKKPPQSKPGEPEREDAERLCMLLADWMERNDPDGKRPRVSKTWRSDMRLLLDVDKRAEEHVRAAIDWCQRNPFWRKNIKSPAKLREHYARMHQDAIDERDGTESRNGQVSSGSMRGGARQELLPADEAEKIDPGSIV